MKVSYELVLNSAVFILSLLLLKFIVHKIVRHTINLPWQNKRRLIVNTNTTLTLVFLVGIVLIWSNQIEALALSIAAFAVAFVVGTKEVISCFLGTIYKGTSTTFNIGDRIEINGYRGDVVDRNFLSTRLLEIGPGTQTHQYTGRSIVIPNSFFLNHAIINESYLGDFVLHVFTIPLPYNDNWQKAEEVMFELACEESKKYEKEASEYIKKIQAKASYDVHDVKPRIQLKIISYQAIEMVVRIAVPAKSKGLVEQTITKKFWSLKNEWHTAKK